MPAPDPFPLDMLALLRGVSRSFYLSIRVLPRSLRRPVAIAYLLARAADTLADTGAMAAATRRQHLEAWAAAIDGRPPFGGVAEIAMACAPSQHDPRERALVEALPRCLAWLNALPPADQGDVRTVLRHITAGQLLDLDRFKEGAGLQALATAAELDDYCYRVAGSVGEFWTRIGERHLADFARLPSPRMHELGRRYGMALQLVNILRDAAADLAAGRCYFPGDALREAGLEPADILREPRRFEGIWQYWHAQARRGIEDGMQYADAVNGRRMRAASALPALLAARTLGLLDEAGPERLRRQVKMPRREVRAVASRLLVTFVARRPLRSLFLRLNAGPAAEWDNRAP